MNIMNICIISPFFMPFVKSSEYGLAQTLTEFGHNVMILTSTSKAMRETMVTKKKYKDEPEFKVKYLTSIDFAENPIVPSVFFHVLKGNYDVVMLREDYPFICHMAYFAAKVKGIATVLTTERTYYPSSFKGFFLKFFDITINKVLRNGVDAYTAHCTAAKDFAEKYLGTLRTIAVIPPGIDTDLFKPLIITNSTYLKYGHPKLLTVARLHEYKGLKYLIKSLADVAKSNTEIKLYIMGKGPEKKNLEKLINELNLDDNVVFLNIAIPNNEMPQLYSECDIYVQPSIIEPFGIAVLEAMACGKAVIGTKTGGMMDTIIDGVTGFSVSAANSEDLSRAIIKLINNRTLLVQTGVAARKESLRYDYQIISRQYLTVINGIIKAKKSDHEV